MAKPSYHQARKQKELARKARQQEKLQRRQARAGAAESPPSAQTADGAAVKSDAASREQ